MKTITEIKTMCRWQIAVDEATLVLAIEGLEDVAFLKPNEFYKIVAEDAEKQLESIRALFP